MGVSTLTAWAASIGTLVTLLADGTFRDAGTHEPILVDPGETFVPKRVASFACERANVRIIGSHVSPLRLTAALAEYPHPVPVEGSDDGVTLTLSQALKHSVFGKNVPSIDTVIAANTIVEEQAA